MITGGLYYLHDLGPQVPIFMRPPYGYHNAAVDATLQSLGFVIAVWTQDSGDTAGDTFLQEQANYNGNGPISEEFGATIPYNQPGQPGGSEFIFLNHDVQVGVWEGRGRGLVFGADAVISLRFKGPYLSRPHGMGYHLGAIARPARCGA